MQRRPLQPQGGDTGEPVTVGIVQPIRPGMEQAFARWLDGVGAAASQFPGHQGLLVMRPVPPMQHDYIYLFRFATQADLDRWERSAVRQQWIERARDLVAEPARKERLTGLEYWFTPPGAPSTPPPRRAKMALVTLLAIYPLSTALLALLGPLLAPLPGLLRGFVISAILVLLMTYVVMPRMSRLFARWLAPRGASGGQ